MRAETKHILDKTLFCTQLTINLTVFPETIIFDRRILIVRGAKLFRKKYKLYLTHKT